MKKSLLKESVMFVTGRRKQLNVNGPKEKVQAFLNVLVASRDLYEALHQENVTLNEIKMLSAKKKKLAKIYKDQTEKDWPM
jgi:hypothetical protein